MKNMEILEDSQKPKKMEDILKNRLSQHSVMDEEDQEVVSDTEYIVDGINALSMYSIIYHGFTKDFQLQSVSVILLSIVASYSRDNKTCWLSQGSMAGLAGTSVPTVHKHLQILEKLKLIEKNSKHKKYGTFQWKLGSTGERKMEEIQKRLRQTKEERDTYKRNKASTQRIFGQ